MVLFLLGMMLLANVSGATPATAQRDNEQIDLAAMLLGADHFEDAGLDGPFFPRRSGCVTLGQQADISTGSSQEIADELESQGWLTQCGLGYGSLPPGSEPGGDLSGEASQIVSSYIHLFDDEEGARSGLDFFEDETSILYADGSGDSLSRNLTFRIDNLVAGVSIHDFTGATPDRAIAEALVDVFRDRIEEVLDDGAPGLSIMALHLERDDLPPMSEGRYGLLDGIADQSALETDAVFGLRIESYRDAEAIYFSRQTIPAGADAPDDIYSYILRLYQFPDDEAAADWLVTLPAVLADTPNHFDVAIRDDAPAYGDESLAIAYAETLVNGETVVSDRIAARVGNVVIDIGFRGAMLPAGIAEVVIEVQIECVEAGICVDPVPVPADLSGDGTTADAQVEEADFSFYGQVFGFEPADDIPVLAIDNL